MEVTTFCLFFITIQGDGIALDTTMYHTLANGMIHLITFYRQMQIQISENRITNYS
jgi:hypothetical protein